VALERQSIEKKDFPIGRRGYDPEAVDSHLSSLADEIEELKRSSRRRTETLASSASEQVRAIVEAAETSANQIQKQADDDAREIRAEANSEAQRTREQATDQARDYVGQVSESTAVMLQRIDAMEGELTALVESLRTGSNRLTADLQLLEGNLVELRGSAGPPHPSFEQEASLGEASAETAAYESGGESPALADESLAETEVHEEYAEAAAPESDQAGEAPAAGAEVSGDSDDTEGARLIALNMALNGTPREETDRYLAANFRLENRDSLLDEVYASVEG
jgi:DivIVA domain-containing protein